MFFKKVILVALIPLLLLQPGYNQDREPHISKTNFSTGRFIKDKPNIHPQVNYSNTLSNINLSGKTFTKFKSKSLKIRVAKKYFSKKKLFDINTTFNNHRFNLGKWLSFSGSISGSLHIQSRSIKYKNIFSYIKKIISIEGEVVITNMAIPFYGRTRKITLTFSNYYSQGTIFDTVSSFSGQIANTLRLSGKLSHGNLSSKVVFNGLNISNKMPIFLSSLFDIRANGEINFSFDKSIKSELKLTGILALLKNRGKNGEYLSLRNQGDIILQYENNRIDIKKAKISIANGEISFKGSVRQNSVNISIDSISNISTFSPWIPGTISRLSGILITKGKISGSPIYPNFTIKSHLKNGYIHSDSGDRLANISFLDVFINNKIIRLKTEILSPKNHKLKLNGTIRHLDFVLDKLAFKIHGEAPGILLNELFKTHLSQISGYATIDLSIGGTYELPKVVGSVKSNKVIVKTRGISKPISFKTIILKIQNRFVTVKSIFGDYSGGSFKVTGFITIQSNFFLNLKIFGINIPWSKRGVFRGEFNPVFTLTGYKNHMTLSGKVDIVTGRYIQKYDILKKLITIHRFIEPKNHLWDLYPWIGNIYLDLSLLSTGDLEVNNNIGTLALDGGVSLKGTIAKVIYKGKVNVSYGSFKIPFLKGTYEVNSGTIDFDKTKRPFLRIQGTTTVENKMGEEILIKLSLIGPTDKISFSLSSFPELEQGQILMLLASGRTTNDLRKQYRGDPRSGTGTSSSSYNPIELYDEPIKQITGDFFSTLVEAPIKMVTKLDLIRFELGSDSFQLKISKKFIKRVKFKGEFEVGFSGQNRQEGGFEIKFHDRLFLDAKMRRYEPGLNEYVYETPLKGKIELKYKLKLYNGLRYTLGF